MNDKNFIEYIYRDLDGELTPAEREELRQYLTENPDAALIEKQCKAIHKQMSASPDISVEPDLKNAIMKQINMDKFAKKAVDSSVKIVTSFWQKPVFRYSFTLAAGIFLGVFLFSLYRADFKPALFDKEMKGTLASQGAPADWTSGDILNFQGWQVKTALRTRYSSSVVELYLDNSSDEMIESTIDFNPDDFDLLVVVNEVVDQQTKISTSLNQLFIQSTGINKIGIKLTNKNSRQHDISLTINRRGSQLYQNKVTINKQSE